MARGIRIVDEQQVVQNIGNLVIAVDGEAKSVGNVFVAHEGIARWVWPPEGLSDDPLVWTADAALSYDAEQLNVAQPQALCNYDARTGRIILSQPDGTETYIEALSPPPRAKGIYLYKFEIVSGEFVTHFPADPPGYNPDMQQGDGSDYYYVASASQGTGNKFTAVVRFRIDDFSGGGAQYLCSFNNSSNLTCALIIYANDHATPDYRRKLVGLSSGFCRVISDVVVADGQEHIALFSYDGTAGTVEFFVDEVDADDTGNPQRVLTTGTLLTSNGAHTVGSAWSGATGINIISGDIGFVGYLRDVYITDPSLFMDGAYPVEIDEIGWTEWGSQPLYWNATGDMTDNKGSAANLTENGTFVQITPTGPPATAEWHDVLEETTVGVYANYLPNTTGVAGQVLGEATVSFALDDGAGNPVAPTIVNKTINFIAEVVGSNFAMTEIPWSLEDIRINEIAIARVTTKPDGILRGFENTVEARSEVYAVTWGDNFQVKVDVLAGAVVGDDTGVWLSTDERRDWNVIAWNLGDDLTATIDLTITDGVTEVTKQITLHAQQTEESATSELSDDFVGYDEIYDEYIQPSGGPSTITRATITFDPDGTVDADRLVQGAVAGFPQDWNTSAPAVPDPENFEIMCQVVSGDSPDFGGPDPDSDAINVWLNLNTARSWHVDVTVADWLEETFSEDGTWDISIREVGRPSTMKTKRVRMVAVVIPFGGGGGGGPAP
jgi:hypothetical protein